MSVSSSDNGQAKTIQRSRLSAREQVKHDYRAYRAAAQAMAQEGALLHGGLEVRVPDHASVCLTEGGAFVEAVVWVPRTMLEQE